MIPAIIIFICLLAAAVYLAYQAESAESMFLYGFAVVFLIACLVAAHFVAIHSFPG